MKKFSFFSCFLLGMLLFGSIAVQAQEPGDAELKKAILKNAGKLHLNDADVNDAIVSSSFYDAATGIRYIYLQQAYRSIGVLNEIKTIALKNDEVVFSAGKFIDNLADKVPAAQASVSAVEAVRKAAGYLSLSNPAQINVVADRFTTEKKYIFGASGIAKQDIEVKLLWVEEEGTSNLHLAWEVSVDVKGSADWWNIRVDAQSGNYINKNNLTVYDRWDRVEDDNIGKKPGIANYPGLPAFLQKQKVKTTPAIVPIVPHAAPPPPPPATLSAIYRVIPYPNDSPYDTIPTPVMNPWEKAGANNLATTYKWHYDGTDYDSTRGNNVHAYLDVNNLNSAGRPNFTARSTTAQPYLTFNFVPNYSVQPTDTVDRLHAITNLFYWNNIIHDITYQYGFTEAAGNFQNTNTFNGVNRGGNGGDYVRAEAQDGSGTDNANFSTPADGSSGRMQMYLWAGPTDFKVTAPSYLAGSYFAKESGFSTANKLKNIGAFSGTVVYYNDIAGTHYACNGSGPTSSVAGKIALIIRGGGCVSGFVEKVKNAQNAGASGVLMINNVAGLPITMGGTDNTITIPAVMISQDDGATLMSQLDSNHVVTLSMTAGPDRDGDLDNGIITHEFTHGISNRLTGGRTNASCLSNAEQGGEGWSDYIGLMLTTKWDSALITDGPKPRAVGNYAAAYLKDGPGIRAYPYSTNMLVNPHTYADVATNTEVHATGEVWCTALWDMTWFIIQQENKITGNLYDTSGTGGNIIAMKLVMEGMKLQTCRPGFLDARDAILAADSILFGFKHKCSIWNAFARRGMGLSAVQGLSTSATDQVAAYDRPSAMFLVHNSTPIITAVNDLVTYTFTASCQCELPVDGYIKDTIPTGFRYVSSMPGGTVSGNVITFSPVSFFTSVNETRTWTMTLRSVAAGCNITTPVNDDRETNVAGGLTSVITTGTTSWIPSTIRSNSGATSWYAADFAGLRDYSLTSNPFTVGSLSTLSFWHYFVLEDKIDAGRVEYSTDGGATWLDANPYFIQNGYNDTTIAASPWGTGARAFTGVTYAQTTGRFMNSIINLSSFAGQTIRIRFRMRTNATNASNQTYDGWFIDDIMLTNGCGGMNTVALYKNATTKVDSLIRPMYQTSGILPLNLLSFTANAIGQSVLLNWRTSNEVNTKSFVVEHSTDAANWVETGNVNAKGNGANTYALYDTKPANGKNYYRIRMVDKDGTVTYSPVQSVVFSAKGNSLFTIMPNPANTSATLYLDKNIKSGKVTVYDEHGRTVQTLTVSNLNNGYLLETSKLAAGTYWVSITTGTTVETGKLVVAH